MSRISLLPKSATAIGLAALGIASAFAWSAGHPSTDRVDPVRLVDGIEQINGVHPGFRRNHPKGVCLVGWFESNGAGASLSRAAVFEPGRFPVIGRFSTGARTPESHDTAKVVRSMALSIALPDGETWRTSMNNSPVFHSRDPAGLRDLLAALKPDEVTGKPDPARMARFLAAHPEAARALALVDAAPVSSGIANTAFNSLNTFRLVDVDGTATPVRWAMQPIDSFEPQTTIPQDRNHYFDSLAARLQQGPVQWRLILIVGRPGDPTNDATQPWPADREKVDAGTLTVIALEREEDGRCRDVVFDPLALPSGIEPSDDPLLTARSAAYAISARRRISERGAPEPVLVGEKAPR